MRVALLGGGTIARLILQYARGGELPGVEIVAVAGRSASSRGAALAREFGIAHVVGRPSRPPRARVRVSSSPRAESAASTH